MRKGDMHQEDDWEAKARDEAKLSEELSAALFSVVVGVIIAFGILIAAFVIFARMI